MERAADFSQCVAIVVVLAQARIEFIDGFQDFFGFLNENAEDLIIQQFFIGALGFGFYRFDGYFRINNRHVVSCWMLPGRLLANREAQGVQAGLGNPEYALIVADALGEPLQIVLNTGNSVGQRVELFPVGNLLAPQQYVGDVTFGGGEHVGHAVKGNQAQATTDAVQEAGDVFDFTGFPLGSDEIDDGRFYLLQRIAGLPQQSAAGFTQFAGAKVDGLGVVAGGIRFRLSVTVQASQTGFDVEQSAGNIHQSAVIHRVRLVGQLLHQFDLFGNDLAGYAQA